MQRLRLGVYSWAHCAVDFSCAFLLLGVACPRGGAALFLLLYNFCAFALQMPLGLLADRLGRCRVWAAGGCLLVLAAFALPPLPAVLCAGVGNAAFHIGGGLDTLNSFTKSAALGLFVSPGAFGLFLGGAAARAGLSFILPCAVLAASALAVSLLCRGGAPNAPVSLASARHAGTPAALCALFFVVALRSAVGLLLQFPWKSEFALLIVIATVLGKACGGLLADKLGAKRTAVVTLAAAALLFVFSDLPVCGLAAVFLFNTTMPLTLHASARLLPGAKGFAFGFLTFALFAGYLPAALDCAFPSGPILYALGAAVSLPLLLLGLRKTDAPC